MKAATLRKQVEAIIDDEESLSEPQGSSHKELFEIFIEIEKWLGDTSSDPANSAAEAEADRMIEAQSKIMRAAAVKQASTPRDILFKLALWRWDKADVDIALEDGRRADAVAYSAFRDLAEMTDEPSVLLAPDDQDKYWHV